jgi:hypothetical protein
LHFQEVTFIKKKVIGIFSEFSVFGISDKRKVLRKMLPNDVFDWKEAFGSWQWILGICNLGLAMTRANS